MDETPNPSLEGRRRRLLFRATHMGTRENDLLVGGFVSARLAALSEAEIDVLEAILKIPDPLLADWLTGRVAIPAEQDTPMLRAMREARGR
jgi:antitoxin CptB